MGRLRVGSAALAAVVALALFGCGSDSDGDATTEVSAEKPTRAFKFDLADRACKQAEGTLDRSSGNTICLVDQQQQCAQLRSYRFDCVADPDRRAEVVAEQERASKNSDADRRAGIERAYEQYKQRCVDAGGTPVGVSNGCVGPDNEQIDVE